ncbi:unnamed protein product [Sphagnum balticum]
MNETGIWNIVQFSKSDIEQKLRVAGRIIQDPKAFLESPGAKSLEDSILFVADELFTNALYNAPFADKDYSLDRSTMVFLDPALSPEIVISHNSKHLFLGCLDHFGSFDCEEFLKRSSKTTKLSAEDFVKLDVGGAGLECYVLLT